ncbi:MAG: RNA polymerase sigma-70 factor [Bacteroidota bacterium]|nr:RNA polymerase sigma-70 factor [Bacteroidota bacterium]
MILTDESIWEKIRNSDNKAFELMFRRFYDTLYLYALGILKNEAEAQEIVNDVFLRIWQKRDKIQINYGIKPYLFRSVFNASTDCLRQKQASGQRSFIEIDDQIMEMVGVNEEYIFNMLQLEEVEHDVHEAINQLPKQCREIFCSSRFELLTYNEISERFNISVNTVKTQIGRAIDSLRQQLGEYL